MLLLPEVLAKPLKDGNHAALTTLSGLLARLDLCPVDRATARLATAVGMGAGRFITNNKRDFDGHIKEIDVTFPADLPAAG